MYSSTATPNAIASDLFSMMSNQETFVDMALIRCFHKAHINPHFDWLQSSDDLKSHLGFQSHHMVVRFFLMEKDLRQVHWGTTMDQHQEAVANYPNDGSCNVDPHFDKLKLFIQVAAESLQKHFPWWLNQLLLPARLMFEEPFAKVIAAAMLDTDMPSFESNPNVVDQRRLSGKLLCDSPVQKCKEAIDLMAFNRFVRKQIQLVNGGVAPQHTRQALDGAQLVLTGDLRTFDYAGDAGAIRLHMHTKCLPLACHTQFVERGVKEAKNVSSTDRSEKHRTWMAIDRSATPLGRAKEDEDMSFNTNKMLATVASSKAKAEPHVKWIKEQGDDSSYDQRFNTVGHC